MGQLFRSLGVSVGPIQAHMSPEQRRPAYGAEITNDTNNEFGFDHLRDNMAMRAEDQVQRGHYYAIVDEVDSILIDEARTPLIISGPSILAHDDQYAKFRPQVETLFHTQERLCNRFLGEAEALIGQLHPEDGSNAKDGQALEREIGLLLYRVKLGQPKSEGLMKLLEDPENLRLMNQAELQLHADQKKTELYAEKEELFFAIDEKSHEADLTEKGRNYMSPKDPDAFMLPDL